MRAMLHCRREHIAPCGTGTLRCSPVEDKSSRSLWQSAMPPSLSPHRLPDRIMGPWPAPAERWLGSPPPPARAATCRRRVLSRGAGDMHAARRGFAACRSGRLPLDRQGACSCACVTGRSVGRSHRARAGHERARTTGDLPIAGRTPCRRSVASGY